MYVKWIKPPRYKTPNFRQKHMNAASVDAEGRVYLFDKEVSRIIVDDRFHFFEEVLDAADWERARTFYGLPKRKRHSLRSHGVRRGEGRQVGLLPKRPIDIIQGERGKEPGEKSGRMPRITKREIKEMQAASSGSDFDFPPEEPPF
ncbi:hypothetical protein RYZ20_13675 [Thioclava sp. A2]|uniref:hypothetical protein n=1 Tax=Thioclava sp. FCG-A2 TaxID=3080562 RepID=UPI002952F132|nr:hypothetical protein [Thioclava sp. A2]MDV7271945.1 hypothetical protein [Thioclava sp. A2]